MSFRRINWENIRVSLVKLYEQRSISNQLEEDEKYLNEAYNYVENKWDEVFKTVKKPKFILFGEAPLYGDEQNYFYNSNHKATIFFNYSDTEALTGLKRSHNKSFRKIEMIQRINALGIFIVDLFPFCFMPKKTAINYSDLEKRNKNLYLDLFEKNYLYFVNEKLEKILSKNKNVKFGFRYDRLKKPLETSLINKINKSFSHFNIKLDGIESFSKQGGGLNTNKLKTFIN